MRRVCVSEYLGAAHHMRFYTNSKVITESVEDNSRGLVPGMYQLDQCQLINK